MIGSRAGFRAAAGVLSVLMVALACSAERGDEASAAAAEPAPDFTLQTLEGGSVTLSELRGRTVLIDFWATWCPPCEFQVPELNAVYEAHHEAGIEVLGVSVDTEGPDVVSEWVTEKKVRYPILMGDEELARQFGALGFPTLVIVSPDGSIHSRHMGLIERQELEETLGLEGESGA